MNFSEAQFVKTILNHFSTQTNFKRICLHIIDKMASKTIMIRSIQAANSLLLELGFDRSHAFRQVSHAQLTIVNIIA